MNDDTRKIPQQVALGERRLLERRVGSQYTRSRCVSRTWCAPTASVSAALSGLQLIQDLSTSLNDRMLSPFLPCCRNSFASMSSRSAETKGARQMMVRPSSPELHFSQPAWARPSSSARSTPAPRRKDWSSLQPASSSNAFVRLIDRSSKPEPTCEAYRSLFPCQYRGAARRAPRAPLPFVYPPITNSALFVALTLSHSGGAACLPHSAVLAFAHALPAGCHRGLVQRHAVFHGMHSCTRGEGSGIAPVTAAVGVACPAQVDSGEKRRSKQ